MSNIRVFAKSRLRSGFKVRSKTETNPNFVCSKSVRRAGRELFGLRQKEISFEIQLFLQPTEKHKFKSQQYSYTTQVRDVLDL